MMEFLLSKIESYRLIKLQKTGSTAVVFCEFLWVFRGGFLEKICVQLFLQRPVSLRGLIKCFEKPVISFFFLFAGRRTQGLSNKVSMILSNIAQIMKFSVKDYFSKYEQIRRKMWTCSCLVKKSLIH